MEKEEYQEMSPEDVKKFEEENMTDTQKERNNEREATLRVGYKEGVSTTLETLGKEEVKSGLKITSEFGGYPRSHEAGEKLDRLNLIESGATKEDIDLIESINEKGGGYDGSDGYFHPYPLSEGQILHLLEVLPSVREFVTLDCTPTLTKEVIRKTLEKFPKVKFQIENDADERERVVEDIRRVRDELGISKPSDGF